MKKQLNIQSLGLVVTKLGYICLYTILEDDSQVEVKKKEDEFQKRGKSRTILKALQETEENFPCLALFQVNQKNTRTYCLVILSSNYLKGYEQHFCLP